MARILAPTPKVRRSLVCRFRSRAGRGGGPVHLSPARYASACGCRLLRSRWLERLQYSVLPSASSAGWIDGRQPGARTLLRRGSYQPPIRSLLARRHLFWWSLTPRRRIKTRARSLSSKGSTLWQQPPPGIFAEFRFGSGTGTRTLNLAVNSRLLYRLSYPGTDV